MFCLSILCLFYIFAFLCFVVLCFVIDPGIITPNVYIYIYIDNIYIGIVTCQFFKFMTVMALNCSLYFVSAHYLQNTCTELGETLHIL